MKEAEKIEPANLRRDMVVSLSPTKLCPCSFATVIPSSDNNGEHVMEKVNREDVRPQPPSNKRKRWTVGDDAEIFGFQCWREGKSAKVLKSELFVVRLFGSIQLKEFHESNLRIQQAWRNNNWSVARSKEYTKNCAENKPQHSGSLMRRDPVPVAIKDSCLREKDGQKQLKHGHNKGLDQQHLERSSKGLISCVGDVTNNLRGIFLF
ncbi:EMSY N-terminal [Salix suchowensis]|nr:EMSY N-terminal [Salix suchowensis]